MLPFTNKYVNWFTPVAAKTNLIFQPNNTPTPTVNAPVMVAPTPVAPLSTVTYQTKTPFCVLPAYSASVPVKNLINSGAMHNSIS